MAALTSEMTAQRGDQHLQSFSWRTVHRYNKCLQCDILRNSHWWKHWRDLARVRTDCPDMWPLPVTLGIKEYPLTLLADDLIFKVYARSDTNIWEPRKECIKRQDFNVSTVKWPHSNSTIHPALSSSLPFLHCLISNINLAEQICPICSSPYPHLCFLCIYIFPLFQTISFRF